MESARLQIVVEVTLHLCRTRNAFPFDSHRSFLTLSFPPFFSLLSSISSSLMKASAGREKETDAASSARLPKQTQGKAKSLM